MKIVFSFLTSLLLSNVLWGINFHDFDPYQKKLTRSEVEEKISTYLKKDAEIEKYYTITDTAFYIYSSPWAKDKKRPEYILLFRKKQSHSLSTAAQLPNKRLSGLKIAIDPGHFGGYLARTEQRFFADKAIQFDEGSLTLETAKILKNLLEKEGAIVLLTKEEKGKGVYPIDFFEWKRRYFPSSEKQDSYLFREEYNLLDLQARAEKINTFKPDVTLVLHYNAHSHEEKTPKTHANYNMVFIPGSFRKKELEKIENRYEFLRLLVTKDLETSHALAKCLMQKLSDRLQVSAPTEAEEEATSYLSPACLKLDSGIYARNLALTRRVHSPVCYGETLCQNNYRELQKLNMKKNPIPDRVKEVATGYYEGLLLFFGK